MNRKARLAFEMLEKEMEVIDKAQMALYKGGNPDITWSPSGWVTDSLSQAFGVTVTSGIDSNNNWVIKFGDNPPIPLVINLDEVTITNEGGLKDADGNSINSWNDWFGNNFDPYTPIGSNGGGGGGSGGGGSSFSTVSYSSISFTQYIHSTEYNSMGYNSAGYNSMGYNSSGYNFMGFDMNGYNSAGYNIDGYNSLGYNSAGSSNPILGTYIYSNGFVQNALANPFFAPNIPGSWADVEVMFSIIADGSGGYFTSDYSVGTASGVTGVTYHDSVANVHTHPNSDAPPSPSDLISLINDATGYSPNLTTSFAVTSSGVTYALVITNKTLAAAFLSDNKNHLDGSYWADGSEPWGVFNGSFSDSRAHGLSIAEAREKATAAVLQGSGVSLLKMEPNTPYVNQFTVIKP